MTAPTCKLCTRVCAKSKGVYLPACSVCWENYLNGDTRDTGAMAQSAYTPLRHGLLTPIESTREWEQQILRMAERSGRNNPFTNKS